MSAGRAAANLFRISSLLDEAIALAIELRAYLERRREPASGAAGELAVLAEARELAQLSAMLSYCLAWLVTREAVHAGELLPQDARGAGYRLGGAELRQDELRQDPRALPWAAVSPPLAVLAQRGRRLYERVARLDGHAATTDASGRVVSAAAGH